MLLLILVSVMSIKSGLTYSDICSNIALEFLALLMLMMEILRLLPLLGRTLVLSPDDDFFHLHWISTSRLDRRLLCLRGIPGDDSEMVDLSSTKSLLGQRIAYQNDYMWTHYTDGRYCSMRHDILCSAMIRFPHLHIPLSTSRCMTYSTTLSTRRNTQLSVPSWHEFNRIHMDTQCHF